MEEYVANPVVNIVKPDKSGSGIPVLPLLMVLVAAAAAAILIFIKFNTKITDSLGSDSKVPQLQTEMTTIKTALEVFNSHKQKYPETLRILVPEYLDENLKDLSTPGIYTYTPGPDGKSFQLCAKQSGGKDFCLTNNK